MMKTKRWSIIMMPSGIGKLLPECHPPASVNKVLLEHRCPICFCIMYCCFHHTKSWEVATEPIWPAKLKILLSGQLRKNNLLTNALHFKIFNRFSEFSNILSISTKTNTIYMCNTIFYCLKLECLKKQTGKLIN